MAVLLRGRVRRQLSNPRRVPLLVVSTRGGPVHDLGVRFPTRSRWLGAAVSSSTRRGATVSPSTASASSRRRHPTGSRVRFGTTRRAASERRRANPRRDASPSSRSTRAPTRTSSRPAGGSGASASTDRGACRHPAAWLGGRTTDLVARRRVDRLCARTERLRSDHGPPQRALLGPSRNSATGSATTATTTGGSPGRGLTVRPSSPACGSAPAGRGGRWTQPRSRTCGGRSTSATSRPGSSTRSTRSTPRRTRALRRRRGRADPARLRRRVPPER